MDFIFEGIDDWNRPVFKNENNTRIGSTDSLFEWRATEEEVLKKINKANLVYFGNKFNCEPDGTRLNPDKFNLVPKATICN